MLKIRKFVKGKDEEVWLKIRNEAFKEYDDFRPSTMEDMEIWEKDPGFDPAGIFIAEWNGDPVGRVQAHVDRQRIDKKGFVRNLGVVPKLREREGLDEKWRPKPSKVYEREVWTPLSAGLEMINQSVNTSLNHWVSG